MKKKLILSKKIINSSDNKNGWLFISPLFVLIVGLFFYPSISIFYKSFQNKFGNWTGLTNYVQLFLDPRFLQASKNTIIFVILSVILDLIVGVSLALLLDLKLKLWIIKLSRGIFMIPWLIASVVAGAVWVLLYHPLGIINFYLGSLGVISEPVGWLADPKLALIAIIVVNVWRAYPTLMIMIAAGLKSIPVDLYEAARVDGAKPYQSFLHVTIPQIKNVIIFITLLDTIWNFQQFDLVYVMTKGGPLNATLLLSNYIYIVTFQNQQFNYGSAMAIFLLIIMMIFSFTYLKITQRSR